MHRSISAGLSAFAVSASLVLSSTASAQDIQISPQIDVPVVGDFQLGPTRFSLSLEPGETRTIELEITNRTGKIATFSTSVEDYAAGVTEKDQAKLYGAEEGPFSARAWLAPFASKFTLRHGERGFLPVEVSVPTDADPGDHYAAVLVLRDLSPDEAQEGAFNILSRVGSIFLITVEGDVVEKARITSMEAVPYINWNISAGLRLHAINDGTVRTSPVGTVQINNFLGFGVDELTINDWTILRNSSRQKDIQWEPRFAFGRYTAIADLKPFPDQEAQTVSASFWVLPLLPMLFALLMIFLVSFLVQYFSARFEFKRKR